MSTSSLSSSQSSLSEIKKFYEAEQCEECQKQQNKRRNKKEYICTNYICKDNLKIVCKECHQQYHEQQYYSSNSKYIQSLPHFLEELYNFIKTEIHKFELINVIIKSASTLLPENYPNYEEMFHLFTDIEQDINNNQLNSLENILQCINNIYMTEEFREQIENLNKINDNITFNNINKFQLKNISKFDDLEKDFTNKLKEQIKNKNIQKQTLIDFIRKRERKICQFNEQQQQTSQEIIELNNKINEIHNELLNDRKQNCLGNNKCQINNIHHHCFNNKSQPHCDECIDAFVFYNKQFESIF